MFVLSSAGDGKLKLLIISDEVKTAEKSFLPLYPLCCAIAPIPNRTELIIAAAFDDYSLRFFLVDEKTTDFTERAKLQIGEDWTTNLAFAKNEKGGLRLAIGNHDHLFRVLEIGETVEEKEVSKSKYRLEVDKKMLSNSNLELKMETILNGHANWVTGKGFLQFRGVFHEKVDF